MKHSPSNFSRAWVSYGDHLILKWSRCKWLACLFLFQVPAAVLADGVVANCTQDELEAAMRNGGRVTFACDGTIVLTNTLTVTGNVVLDGTGRDVTLSGNNQVRVFEVRPGVSLGLVKLTVANGRTVGPGGLNGGPAFGGGIYNERGIVSITNCALVNHHAAGGDGFDISGQPNRGGAGFGGAVYNWEGTLTLFNSSVLGCRASGGAAIGAPLTAGGHAAGGAIWSGNGTVNLLGTTLRGNQALGAVALQGGYSEGGALFAVLGVVAASNSVFSANQALGGNGPGIQGYPGGAAGGAVYLEPNTALRCFRTRFDHNSAVAGLGRYPGSTSGGAIHNRGTLLLAQCELSGNRTFNPADAASGGALYNAQEAVLYGTTLSDNIAEGGVNRALQTFYGLNGAGGAILNVGALACTNTTFEGNVAQGGHPTGCFSPPAGSCTDGYGQGGALCNIRGTAYLAHVTLARNQAISTQSTPAGQLPRPEGAQGGALFTTTSGMVTLLNSLLAHGATGSNCFGTPIDAGHNLSSDASCAFTGTGSLNNQELKLSLLDDFGGPTRTVALLAGSPALDAADSAGCPATDQRGVARPFGPGCDIGAFESAPPYSIRGHVLGWQPDGLQISAGAAGTSPVNGVYLFNALATGDYAVVPSGADRVFQPHSRQINLVTDAVDVDFFSFRTNGLTAVRNNQKIIITFAGAPQEDYELVSSPDLSPWATVTPFRTDTEGLYQFSVTTGPGLGNRIYGARKP